MTKATAKVKLILWSAVAVIAGGALLACALLVGGGHSLYRQDGNVINDKDTVDLTDFVVMKEVTLEDSFQSLSLDWITGHVSVLKSQDGRTKLVQKGMADMSEKYQMTYALENNTLKIIDRNKCNRYLRDGNYNRSTEWTDLEIYLPQKQYDTLLFRGTSPKISAEGLQAKLLNVDITSGRISFTKCEVPALNFKATSGSITCDTAVKAKLDIDMTSGNAKISGPITDIVATGTSGTMRIKTSEKAVLHMDTTSGEMDAEGSFTQVDAKTTSGTLKVTSAILPSSINGRVSSGKLKLYLPKEESGFTAEVDRDGKNGFECEFPVIMEGNVFRYGQEKASYTFALSSGTIQLYENKLSIG